MLCITTDKILIFQFELYTNNTFETVLKLRKGVSNGGLLKITSLIRVLYSTVCQQRSKWQKSKKYNNFLIMLKLQSNKKRSIGL